MPTTKRRAIAHLSKHIFKHITNFLSKKCNPCIVDTQTFKAHAQRHLDRKLRSHKRFSYAGIELTTLLAL